MKAITLAIALMLIEVSIGECQSWEPLGGGVKGDGAINALAVDTFHNLLFAGGYFDSIGTVKAKNLAAWDGIKWHKLPVQPETVGALVM
ncbi:MAG: hypothetical protein ACHQD9_06100, partial [Chitinophagales bacterium]